MTTREDRAWAAKSYDRAMDHTQDCGRWIETGDAEHLPKALGMGFCLDMCDLARRFEQHRLESVSNMQQLAAKQANTIIRLHSVINEIKDINMLFDAHTERVTCALKKLTEALAEEEIG